MKLLILLFITFPIFAWEKMSTDTDSPFWDKDSLEVMDDGKRRIKWYANDSNKQFSQYRYFEFNCNDGSYRTLEATAYQFPNLTGKSLNENADPKEVKHLDSNKDMNLLSKNVCGLK
jgi:hypothetical protein